MNINAIKSKSQETKKKGPNPFEYVGVTFSDSGKTVTLWEKINGEWIKYDKIDGSASYQLDTPIKQDMRGNGYNLSYFYSVYCWVDDSGYQNFSNWVD
ncbi:hypothetical protein QUO02_004960 [Vibrio alginolyticus]|nr:hypothetical protein [Vibrio alginolyticus]ELA9245707.1 hypothetical protein [Vibrio alginolyticus]